MGDRTCTRRPSVPERFWARVDTSGDCWLWTGPVDRYGYGRRKYKGRTLGAHRVSYMLSVGPLPEGVPLDHTCHDRSCTLGTDCAHRRCVNPEHLQVTTVSANTKRGRAGMLSHADYERRGTCRAGHPWVPENICIRRSSGETRRLCLLCERARTARYKAKRRTAQA